MPGIRAWGLALHRATSFDDIQVGRGKDSLLDLALPNNVVITLISARQELQGASLHRYYYNTLLYKNQVFRMISDFDKLQVSGTSEDDDLLVIGIDFGTT